MKRHNVISFIISVLLITTATFTFYSCSKTSDVEQLNPNNNIADIISAPPPIKITPVLAPALGVPAIMTSDEFTALDEVDQKFYSAVQEEVNQLYFLDDLTIGASFTFNIDPNVAVGPIVVGPLTPVDPNQVVHSTACTICINGNNTPCRRAISDFYKKYGTNNVMQYSTNKGGGCFTVTVFTKYETTIPGTTNPIITIPGGGFTPARDTISTVLVPHIPITTF